MLVRRRVCSEKQMKTLSKDSGIFAKDSYLTQ